MPSPRRIEKLNVLFREQIAGIVDREVEFGDGALMTITRVALSPDAHYADVFISVLGVASAEADALARDLRRPQPVHTRANEDERVHLPFNWQVT